MRLNFLGPGLDFLMIREGPFWMTPKVVAEFAGQIQVVHKEEIVLMLLRAAFETRLFISLSSLARHILFLAGARMVNQRWLRTASRLTTE